MYLLFAQYPFNAAIRHQPHQCDKHVDAAGDPWFIKGRRNRGRIQNGRYLSFDVATNRFGQYRSSALTGNYGLLQYEVSNCSQQEHAPIEGHRSGGKMIMAHPASYKRKERQPEQKMQVGPQDPPGHVVGGGQHVMMVVPVDAEIHETEDVAQKHRQQGIKHRKVGAVWHLHFQHHDGDDDGENTIAECF